MFKAAFKECILYKFWNMVNLIHMAVCRMAWVNKAKDDDDLVPIIILLSLDYKIYHQVYHFVRIISVFSDLEF